MLGMSQETLATGAEAAAAIRDDPAARPTAEDAEWEDWGGPRVEASSLDARTAALQDPLMQAFEIGGRSSLSRFTKAEFDRALGAYLPTLLPDSSSELLHAKMAALLEASPACALPHEFSLLFSTSERRFLCDLRATVVLDSYLERFAPTFRDLPTAVYLGSCALCCSEDALIRERRCCRLPACADCLRVCVRLALAAGRPQVDCPGCPAAVRRDELSLLHLRADPALMRRHQQLIVDCARDPTVKTCPSCGHICRRSGPDPAPEVTCEACGQPWCFVCHGPRHPGRACLDAADTDRQLLLAWSRQMRLEDGDETGTCAAETRTARPCPQCGAIIERSGGCRQVTCGVCRTDFCYLCGKKYQQDGRYLGLLPKHVLGSHESRLSIHGCSANLLPERPRLRRALRHGALALAVGGAAVAGLAASPLLLLSSPVWVPILAVRERRRQLKRKNSSNWEAEREETSK